MNVLKLTFRYNVFCHWWLCASAYFTFLTLYRIAGPAIILFIHDWPKISSINWFTCGLGAGVRKVMQFFEDGLSKCGRNIYGREHSHRQTHQTLFWKLKLEFETIEDYCSFLVKKSAIPYRSVVLVSYVISKLRNVSQLSRSSWISFRFWVQSLF